MHAHRGNAVCKNNLLIRRKDLERQLLAGLQERVLHPDVVACTLKRFEEELGKALASQRQGDADLRRQIGEIERAIANQLRALRDGYSPAITADLAKLESQLAGVHARLKTSDPGTVKLQMRHTRRFVESRLSALSALWDGEPRLAREGIAKHVQKITLKAIHRTYVASGNWDWLGNVANCVVPGPGTNGSRHPLHHQGRGINSSSAMRCAWNRVAWQAHSGCLDGCGGGKWTERPPITLNTWLSRNRQVGGAEGSLSAALAMVFA